jgi:hypothetical protein
MAPKFRLEKVWNDRDFYVHKGVLEPQGTLPGEELGNGMVYYSGTHKVKHQVPGSIIIERPVLRETGRGVRCLWNEGQLTEIVNAGKNPTHLFRVGLNVNPKLEGLLPQHVAVVTGQMLRRKWPPAFEASLNRDLDTIGLLAQRYATGSTPSARDLARAKLAKEDLEFKVKWFATGSSKAGRSATNGWGAPASSKSETQFYSVYNVTGPGGGGPGTSPSTPALLHAIVQVTVNTKDSVGAKASGYRVFANTYFSKDDVGEAQPFSELSTPTSEPLAVGRYWLWAEKETLKSQPIAIPIGTGNRRAQTVDLVVPRA